MPYQLAVVGNSLGNYSSNVVVSSSKIGIGVTPSYKLDVSGTTQTSYLIVNGGATNRYITCLNSSLNNESYTFISFGKYDNPWNLGEVGYYHAGDGNDYNKLILGLHSVRPATVCANGFVGIGTETPLFPLHIAKDNALSGNMYAGDPGLGQLILSGATTTTSRLALMYDTTNDIGVIQALTSFVSSRPVCLNAAGGNVGIGTITPGYTLDVVGDINCSGNFKVNGVNFTGGTPFNSTSDVTVRNIDSTGRILASAGNGEGNGYTFTDNPGGGGWDTAYIRYYARTGEACTLEIGTTNDADDHILLNPAGNVGIGVAAPAYKLDVSGEIKATNDIFLNTISLSSFVTWAKSQGFS